MDNKLKLIFIFLIIFLTTFLTINLSPLFSKDNSLKDSNFRVFYINTNGSERYNGVIYDENNYYIVGYQLFFSMKYAIIKLNSDLNLSYAKYYTPANLDKLINVGLTNLWFDFNNNDELFAGGWYSYGYIDNGIIGKIDKNTGNFRILKNFSNIGEIYLITDKNYLYGVSSNGYIFKLDSKNLRHLDSKIIFNSRFCNISLNNSYISTYDYRNNRLLVLDKDLRNCLGFYVNGYQEQVPLIDNENNLYLVDSNRENLGVVISKISLNNLDIPLLINSKEYFWNNSDGKYSGAFLNDKNIILVITIQEFNTYKNFVKILKISKDNLNIINQIKLVPLDLNQNIYTRLMTIFPTIDNSFFGVLGVNPAEYNLFLKMSNNFQFNNNNKILKIYDPMLKTRNFKYKLSTQKIILNNTKILEKDIIKLREENVKTVLKY
ncbi:MAG: hypothetical protein N2485_00240 [bacterium]|nr:hypothetical protein [bacterium]